MEEVIYNLSNEFLPGSDEVKYLLNTIFPVLLPCLEDLTTQTAILLKSSAGKSEVLQPAVYLAKQLQKRGERFRQVQEDMVNATGVLDFGPMRQLILDLRTRHEAESEALKSAGEAAKIKETARIRSVYEQKWTQFSSKQRTDFQETQSSVRSSQEGTPSLRDVQQRRLEDAHRRSLKTMREELDAEMQAELAICWLDLDNHQRSEWCKLWDRHRAEISDLVTKCRTTLHVLHTLFVDQIGQSGSGLLTLPRFEIPKQLPLDVTARLDAELKHEVDSLHQEFEKQVKEELDKRKNAVTAHIGSLEEQHTHYLEDLRRAVEADAWKRVSVFRQRQQAQARTLVAKSALFSDMSGIDFRRPSSIAGAVEQESFKEADREAHALARNRARVRTILGQVCAASEPAVRERLEVDLGRKLAAVTEQHEERLSSELSKYTRSAEVDVIERYCVRDSLVPMASLVDFVEIVLRGRQAEEALQLQEAQSQEFGFSVREWLNPRSLSSPTSAAALVAAAENKQQQQQSTAPSSSGSPSQQQQHQHHHLPQLHRQGTTEMMERHLSTSHTAPASPPKIRITSEMSFGRGSMQAMMAASTGQQARISSFELARAGSGSAGGSKTATPRSSRSTENNSLITTEVVAMQALAFEHLALQQMVEVLDNYEMARNLLQQTP